MNRYWSKAALLLAGLLAALPAVPARADTLARPARLSALAPRAMLLALALAQAGGRLVAVGERGIILYSDDGGARWTQAEVPVSSTLTSVAFADRLSGYAAGHDGVILHTSDGGGHWRRQLDGRDINAMLLADARAASARARAALDALAPMAGKAAAEAALDAAGNAVADREAAAKSGPDRPLLAIWFRNVNEGYAVGAFGQALRTADGGAHWLSMSEAIANPDGLHLSAIGAGAGGALLMAGEGGKVYRSSDQGLHWQVLDTGYRGQLYGAIECGGALLAYGFGGNVLRSADGGRSWQTLPRLATRSLIGAVHGGDGSLLLVGRDGSVLRSTDQGRRFAPLLPDAGLELAGAVALDPGATRLAVAGIGGVHVLTLPGAVEGGK